MNNKNNYFVNKVEADGGNNTKKWSFQRHNYGLWYIKDSRNLSGFVGIFLFIVMMVIFILNLNTSSSPNTTIKSSIKSLHNRRINNLKESGHCLWDKTYNRIQCPGVTPDVLVQVQDEINDLASKHQNDNGDPSLAFVNLQESTNIIKPSWLNNVKVNISSLTIQDTSLPLINDGSFEGGPFFKMTELTLIAVKSISLFRGSFSGLSNLASLSLRGPDTLIIHADEDTLQYISNTLSTLQMEECISDPQVLKNLTGGDAHFHLTTLSTLDVSVNSFKTLFAKTFSKISNLLSLYLEKCDLSDGLDKDVFDGLRLGEAHSQILITDTKLTSLPQGIFKTFTDSVSIGLYNNHWNCICSFKWFQDLVISSKMFTESSELECFIGEVSTNLKTFQFCDPTTRNPDSTMIPTTPKRTTSRITTARTTTSRTTTTEIPSTPSPEHYEKIYCFSPNRTIFPVKSSTRTPVRIIYLGEENARVEFEQIEDEPKYNVFIEKSLGDDMVLVFINEAGWVLCLTDIRNNFILENLEYGETYVVCLLEASKHTVSPKNCQSLSVPLEWTEQTWIKNGSKLFILMGVVSGTIFTIGFSSLCMYIYIKRNPNVVYGKENVIVVERENSSAPVKIQEPNYEQPKYPASLASWSDGYLTPKVYESVEDLQIPCIDQIPPEYFRRTRISPGNRSDSMKKSTNSSQSEIYETINMCPSVFPSHYNMESNISQNIYDSL